MDTEDRSMIEISQKGISSWTKNCCNYNLSFLAFYGFFRHNMVQYIFMLTIIWLRKFPSFRILSKLYVFISSCLQGGKDRGLPFQLLKVPLDSVASHCGCQETEEKYIIFFIYIQFLEEKVNRILTGLEIVYVIHTLHCTEYPTFYIVQSTVYILQSTVYSLQSTVYSLQSTVYSLQSAV